MEADFQEYILPRYKNVIPVEYVFQELDMLPAGFTVNPERVKPYGTAHAILVAKDAIKEPFTVINADDFYGKEPFQILADYLTKETANDPSAFAMVGYRLANTLSENGTVSRGVCKVDDNGYLTVVKEMRKIARTENGIQNDEDGVVTPLTGEEPVSMNFWGFSPMFFDRLESMFAQFLKDTEDNIKAEFPIPDAVSAVMASGDAKVRLLPTKSEWFGVTYAEDRPMVVEKLKHVE